jgi:hypothetical protein
MEETGVVETALKATIVDAGAGAKELPLSHSAEEALYATDLEIWDRLVAAAVCGTVSSELPPVGMLVAVEGEVTVEEVARFACDVADAVMVERAKRRK